MKKPMIRVCILLAAACLLPVALIQPAHSAATGKKPAHPGATGSHASSAAPSKSSKSKVVTTASGLKYEDIKVGTGPTPKTGDTVSVHYTSSLASGKKFDSSYDRGAPYTFSIGAGQVIAGWDEGVIGMKAGGRRKLTIPAQLAYGAAGVPGSVPANATLVVDMELLSVKAPDPNAEPIVNMVTARGTITIKLFPKDAPITVANFIKLVNQGFYNGLAFHRVESSPDFRLIQGGDPNGNGSGGPGYNIKGEFKNNGVDNPQVHDAGAVAMARSSAPDSAGSQFYICINAVHQLDGNYAVFGKVISGLDVADKIVVGDKMVKVTMETTSAAAPKETAGSAAPKEVVTPSGLKYTDIVVGKGESPKPGQTVSVHYTGTLTNGTKFDSSRDRGQPFEFTIGEGQVIKGWDEGVMSMKVGGRRKLTIPPDLGYGANGAGGVIPPNSTLIFDVELLEIKTHN